MSDPVRARPSAAAATDTSTAVDSGPSVRTAVLSLRGLPHPAAQLLRLRRAQRDRPAPQLNLEPGRCWTELEMPRRFEGWEGIIHGGILCTILDEVMAWALVQDDSWGVTARMSVDFRRPVTVGQSDPGGGLDHRVAPPHPGHGRDGSSTRRRALSWPRPRPRTSPLPKPGSASSRNATALRKGPCRERRGNDRAGGHRGRAIGDDRRVEPLRGRAPGSRLWLSATGWRSSSPDPDAFVAAIAGRPRPARRSRLRGRHQVRHPRPRAPCSGFGCRCWMRPTRPSSAAPARPQRHSCSSAMDRLLREELPEIRWFGIWNLGRSLADGSRADVAAPARGPLARRTNGSPSTPWPTPTARESCATPRRWAEIEQLVYSPSRWERRLVGSTWPRCRTPAASPGARSPVVVAARPGAGGPADRRRRARRPEGALLGAARRSPQLDARATTRFLEAETATARATDDGHRAWVIRDSVSKLPAETAARLRTDLDGIRRHPGAPSTSWAAAIAAEFATARHDRLHARAANAQEE